MWNMIKLFCSSGTVWHGTPLASIILIFIYSKHIKHIYNYIFIFSSTGIFYPILSVPRKFYLIKEPKTWNEARAYCQANKTDLATIESNDDLLQLRSVAVSQLFTSSAWIGLYNDIGGWRWSLEDMPLGTLRSWADQEPDNHNGEEQCVLMRDGIWSDKPCTNTKKFICFDGEEQHI